MKKLVLALALVLSTIALQACDADCFTNLHGSNMYSNCPVPGSMIK